MFRFLDQLAIVLREAPGETGRATNSFSTSQAVGETEPLECHRCQCEQIYDQVMSRVLRVKNMCANSGNTCTVENFAAQRRRNKAISADYANIYMKPTGEAKRLKFAGGAALGSTHIGFGMDTAADALDGWGTTAAPNEPADIVLEDGTRIKNDGSLGDLVDWQEIGSWVLTGDGWFDGVTYDDTLVGLRRLIYGNLAIYMDLGAVLHFCQMHEERFHFFRDGKVEEFIECFDHFVNYVKDKYAGEHEVYGGQGTFGSPEGGYLRNGLRGIATDDFERSLTIIDHEQRNILEDFMYRLNESSVPSAAFSDLGNRGGDSKFRKFMNALEQVAGNRYGPGAMFSGIRGLFSATPLPYRIEHVSISIAGVSSMSLATQKQPFMYPFTGGDFSDQNVRTPWFKDVVRHFVRAENEDFTWPDEGTRAFYPVFLKRGGEDLGRVSASSPPQLKPLLCAEIQAVAAAGLR
ncbi:MAG: hypothetical protein ACK5JR_11380 [Tropicimonas sp.]|uniref:hypothetical protein n=1 Tax=Tropicimonas sp. TaxID=2067044 RepID=UPI003A87E85C